MEAGQHPYPKRRRFADDWEPHGDSAEVLKGIQLLEIILDLAGFSLALGTFGKRDRRLKLDTSRPGKEVSRRQLEMQLSVLMSNLCHLTKE